MIKRWTIAIVASFLLHALLGVYYVINIQNNTEMTAARGPIEIRLSNFTTTPLLDRLAPAASPSEDETLPVPQEAVAAKLTSPQKSETKPETPLSVKPKIPPPLEADVPVEKEQNEEPLATSSTVEKTDEEPPTEVPENTNQGEQFTQAGLLIVTNPVYLKRSPPVYPRDAIRRHQQGRVIVNVTIDEQGYVVDMKLYKSSGFKLLDRSALKAVKVWQFEPARRNGIEVMSVVRIPVYFQLSDR
jgi:protein TonB